MKSQKTSPVFKTIRNRLCPFVAFVLLIQSYESGNGIVDLLVLGIGTRIAALGLLIWFFSPVRHDWRRVCAAILGSMMVVLSANSIGQILGFMICGGDTVRVVLPNPSSSAEGIAYLLACMMTLFVGCVILARWCSPRRGSGSHNHSAEE